MFEPPIRNIEKPLRMSIAETLKSRTLGQAAVSGKLEAGAVRVGSKVRNKIWLRNRGINKMY